MLCAGVALGFLSATHLQAAPPAPYYWSGGADLGNVGRSFYDYDAQTPFRVTEVPGGEEQGIRLSTITYPSPVVTPFAANNMVTAHLFLPPGPGPFPAMVVLHEWNGESGAQKLCRVIAGAGVAALLVTEPYSLNRRSPGGPGILSGDPPQMRDALRQAVLDARGVDWIICHADRT